MNLTGRSILITGATDGLGRRIAERIAPMGATLLIHGRDREKGEAVLKKIAAASGSGTLHYYNADLSCLEQVRSLAGSVAADHPALDVLVNNAGLGAGPQPQRRETSPDGFELRLAVNYLAPFLLTRLLRPNLRRAAEQRGEARIVNVASAAQQAIDFDDPQLERGYKGMRAYSQSKLALVMFTFDLTGELAGSKVTANALHPASLMDTKMVREWLGTPRTSVEEGARALERLIRDEKVEGVSGAYFKGLERARAAPQAYDEQARERLRSATQRWVGL